MNWVLIAIILPVGYFVLRILESILLNVVGNILTDPVKNWLANRSLLSKRKRIDQLKKEYNTVTEFHDDKNKLYLHVIQNGLFLFIPAFFVIIFTLIFITEQLKNPQSPNMFWSLSSTGLVVIFLALGAIIWNSMTTLLERIIKYDNYKAQVERRILELSNKQSVTPKAG